MPQNHLDRLTSIDASFLAQEGHASHMHIGGVLIFDGPPPAFADFLDHVRGRLHLVPRYRQKLSTPPMETGRPLWVDDPSFNLEYHVRHAALPAPGTESQLFQLAARVHSQQLDRERPLWEVWLVEGLEGDRFALINKTHHSLVDGVSGVDLATVLFDVQEAPAPAPTDLEPWQPKPEPTAAELVLAGARGMVNTMADLMTRALGAATRPGTSLTVVRDALEGLGEIVWAGLNPAPQTPLNVPIGPHRRYSVVRQQLSDYKEVKNALGGTVNDVVLTVVSGAIARWLHSRGIRTEGLEMRALVPVSIRTEDDQGTLGNRLTVMRGPLPVYIERPGGAPALRQGGDGRAQGVKAGRGCGDDGGGDQPRAADRPGPGLAAELLHAPVQPDRDQHPRPADAAVRARPPARGPVPRRVPALEPRAWRSRSCPTTGGSTTACSPTTTRCPTSRSSPRESTPRSRSCSTRLGGRRARAGRGRQRRRRRARAGRSRDRQRQRGPGPDRPADHGAAQARPGRGHAGQALAQPRGSASRPTVRRAQAAFAATKVAARAAWS